MMGERFEVDGQAVDAETFRRVAIDPQWSVTVDACAGSGKTTLLVARIVRALLEGAQPDQVLAITFTRLAAHEMRERLMATLRRLAGADDAGLQIELIQWFGLAPSVAQRLAGRARDLYEMVLCDVRGVDITTFHRWFKVLGSHAPLPQAASAELTEDQAALQHQAWYAWLDYLRTPAWQNRRTAFEDLIVQRGVRETRAALLSLLASRTEWLIALMADPLAELDDLRAAAERAACMYFAEWQEGVQALCASHGGLFAPVTVSQDATPVTAFDDALAATQVQLVRALARSLSWQSALQRCARVLAQGTKAGVLLAQDIEAFLTRAVALDDAAQDSWTDWFEDVRSILLTKTLTPRIWKKSQALDQAQERAGGEAKVQSVWQMACDAVREVHLLRQEAHEVWLNARLMRCGADLMWVLRELKHVRGVMDFADLESVAYQMLRDPGAAAYVQCRMDRRYRHLLFDEFQDTSSLQWRVIADWLSSYAGSGAGERPSVFVVGDPKQSIYRFRGAEARVFDAAKEMLREVFAARQAATDTTRRNVPTIVAALNHCLPDAMPHYRWQATAADGPGLVWRLPLVTTADDAVGGADEDGAEEDDAISDARRALLLREGAAIAQAIVQARAALAAQGKSVAWGSVFVLARSRKGFECYEQALRAAGLPVQSDRAGGLLRSLEVEDLRALLRFVRRPSDDLALVQVMASPLLGMSQDELGDCLAQLTDPAATGVGEGDGRRSLWGRMNNLAARVPDALWAQRPITEWVALLADWMERARRVPAHDLLDSVLAQQQAWVRYAAVVPPAQRAVALANLNALLGHALDFDGGRCPSLARYLAHLRGLDGLEAREGPSEGRSDTVAAIRLMTIHASKGLEADLVVLAGAHAQTPAVKTRMFVDWAPEWLRPEHVSFVQNSGAQSLARRARLEREEALRAREEGNLLYVALTRARHGLIISGTATQRALSRSWYTALAGLDLPPAPTQGTVAPPSVERTDTVTVRAFLPPPLNVGKGGVVQETSGGGDESLSEEGQVWATEMGHALHRALELSTQGHPPATIAQALQSFALNAAQQQAALAQAASVLCHPDLALALALEAPALNEFEIFDVDGQLRRLDRVVQVGDELWIIDYKWSVDATRRPLYVQQLADYRRLLGALEPKPWGEVAAIRTVLVDAKARQVEFDADLKAGI